MTEQNSSESVERVVVGCRSQLLLPIMEGNTLESEDVAEFLSLRLAANEPAPDASAALRLS
jgi:hypothetical protein